jgi:hypothetical protein
MIVCERRANILGRDCTIHTSEVIADDETQESYCNMSRRSPANR